MKIEDIIDKMSKSYLERIVKSYTTEIYTKDEAGYKKQITNNIDFFSDKKTIQERLRSYIKESRNPYEKGLLINFILKVLLGSNHYMANKEEIIDNIRKLEEEILKKSNSKESFTHIGENSLEILETVLSAAFEDDTITEDELYLISKIRKKLSIQQKDQYLIQAKLNHFPQKNNEIHNHEQINEGLIDLQKCGVVFYANQMENQPFIIPEELTDGVKNYLGIELIDDKFRGLLDLLKLEELRGVLEMLNIKQYGKKDELIERILITGINPSEVMHTLSSTRLTDICKRLPDVKSSGTKEDKINRVISYFDVLLNIDVNTEKDKREVYYNFFEQLAKRDMANLIGKKVVKHETEAENAFEIATAYLFEKKLNHPVVKQKGTEHSDGCVVFDKAGNLLLWDNKAKIQDKYDFPNAHLRQFKRYIRDYHREGKRVSCFLIIVPDFEESANNNAVRLKYESGIDTDVAIIAAEDLKWIAEEWAKSKGEESFNLQVFNMTGLLTKEEIKSRMKLFT